MFQRKRLVWSKTGKRDYNSKMSTLVDAFRCDVNGLRIMVCFLARGDKPRSFLYEQEINLSKPSGFFTYHQVQHSKILHGARFAFSVLYGSENRQRPILYTALTGWFL